MNRYLVFVLLFAFFTSEITAQSADATMSGYVTDPSGSGVPNAKVALKNPSTGVSRTTQTNGTGFYLFTYVLPAQSYELSVEAPGFQRQVHPDIRVEVAQSVRTDFPLQVGQTQQEITVSSGAQMVQTDNASLGQVISSRQVNELPLNGRNPLALVALAPSVVPQGQAQQNGAGTNNSAYGNYQIGGGTANQSQWLLDGATMVTPFGHAVELLPSQEVVQEFKVQTNNLGAEYGGFAGGVVNLSTKAGTNDLHGNVYEFLRNKELNANSFFNNRNGVPTGAFTQNQFGATLGGPVMLPHLYNGRNKTFFFLNYEGFRLRQGQGVLLSVPTQAMRNGDFTGLGRDIYNPFTTTQVGSGSSATYTRAQASCNGRLNVICPSQMDPVAVHLISLWSLPNVAGAGFVNNWAGNVSFGGNTDQGTIRLDHTLTDKQRLFFRYTKWADLDLAGDAFGNQTYAGNVGTPAEYSTQQAVLSYTYTLTPTTVMDLHTDVLRFVYARTPESVGFDATTIGWPSYFNTQVADQVRTLPNICVSDNYNEFCGQGTGSVIDAGITSIGMSGSVSSVHGKHTIKTGGEVRIARSNYGQTSQGTGTYTFNSTFTGANPQGGSGSGLGFASFLFGTPQTGSVQEPAFTASQQVYRGVYVTDTYQVTPKLTLNLGIRYEQTGPWTERLNRISVFFPGDASPLTATTGLPLSGALNFVASYRRHARSAVNTAYNQWSPHMGLAYSLTPSTVIRAGYGIFWLPIDTNLFSAPDHDSINAITQSMNTSLNGGITPFATLANPFPNGIVPPPQRNGDPNTFLYGQGITTQVSSNLLGYAQQWNFDIQKQFGPNFLIDAAYAGSKGTHLPFQTQSINFLPASYLALGPGLLQTVANPFAGKVPSTSPFSTSTISAGQLLRPFPQFGSVTLASQGSGDSTYHSFQLSVSKRFGAGGTALLAYTNSKLIGNTETLSPWLESSGPAGAQYWGNLRLEKSLASYDVSQRVVLSYVVDLPVGKGRKYLAHANGLVQAVAGGWGLDGILTFQTGFPLALTTSTNNTHDLGGGSRPNYLAGSCPNGYGTSGSRSSRLGQWFNTACFGAPPPYTFGNVARTLPNLRSDGIHNLDFALFKNFGFGANERFKVQVRGEAFNLLNTPQFGTPNTSLGSQTFGQVTSQVNNPRLIQVAGKLIW
ncbi:MAG: carboxypeptidase regulatory-like domain-containing protein [Bryobacteraceae bacterium]